MNGRRPIGKQLEEFLVSMAPAIAHIGIVLSQVAKAAFRGLDTPSGRALRDLRTGGDLVAAIAQDEEECGGKGIAVLTIAHGYGPLPDSVIAQANRAARQVVITWDVTRDSPRWN
jgi:hypothetical protein